MKRLLAWYDKNARRLPWRVSPQDGKRGVRPDPYRVWLSEIMLQQTTAKAVAPRFTAFVARWPHFVSLAAAPVEDVLAEWAGLGYYARARNLHKCAVEVVREHAGRLPDTEEALRALPGIGTYTAAAIAAIAFERRAVAVDGNVERVMARLFAVATPLPTARPKLRGFAQTIWPTRRSGDFAQALMDLGAAVCTPRAPHCGQCPLADRCLANARGSPESFPKRARRRAKPLRRGIVYALTNARGEVLLERRPVKGLLGGMLGLPGTTWLAETPTPAAPARTRWRRAGAVSHVFTHFRLDLAVLVGEAPAGFVPRGAQIWLPADAAPVPTVMAKALRAALGNGDARPQLRGRR